MEIENLKLIIEMINTIGANSKDAFIWWLLIVYGKTYLFGLIWSAIGLVVFSKLFRIMSGLQVSERLRVSASVSIWFTEYIDRASNVLRENSLYIKTGVRDK